MFSSVYKYHSWNSSAEHQPILAHRGLDRITYWRTLHSGWWFSNGGMNPAWSNAYDTFHKSSHMLHPLFSIRWSPSWQVASHLAPDIFRPPGVHFRVPSENLYLADVILLFHFAVWCQHLQNATTLFLCVHLMTTLFDLIINCLCQRKLEPFSEWWLWLHHLIFKPRVLTAAYFFWRFLFPRPTISVCPTFLRRSHPFNITFRFS